MNHAIEQVHSFGRCDSGRSDVYEPTNVDEVKQVFALARASHGARRIVIRGGGHSFDGQALHANDDSRQIIMSTARFQRNRMEFSLGRNMVTLGSGVCWQDFIQQSIAYSAENHAPVMLPGSMQTGGGSTVGGTLAADCLSRFSGLGGKESAWIESFSILTPEANAPISVSEASNPDLFHAVIGGHGYIGFVTEATYRLIPVDYGSCAHTEITLHQTLASLIQKQLDLVASSGAPRGISSAWFTDQVMTDEMKLVRPEATAIKGGVFNSCYARPSGLPHFPLYNDLHSVWRYVTEIAARDPLADWMIHEALYRIVQRRNRFDDNLAEFLFFMDGDTFARKKFEDDTGDSFPLVQQTFVVPAAVTESFTISSMNKIADRGLHATEYDMLYIKRDSCFLSANYNLDGFAVTFAFEPLRCGNPDIDDLLRDLSVDCLQAGGRIHLPKNSHIDKRTFRAMFNNAGQLDQFERLKRLYDPNKLLQNPFSDKFFNF
jgi:decaprenylphospho-beta-D-ribofuranose 2-oxidase